MSGTSLDGLDIAVCEFSVSNNHYNYKILGAKTVKYDKTQKNKLVTAPYFDLENYFILNHRFGKFIGSQVKLFLSENKLKASALASHGHTIFHQPSAGFSTQIGCGASIAAASELTTICDFRSLDIALGGQGAPLVPIGDKLLFGKYQSCLNIGGIMNISMDDSSGKRIAFDMGVANMAFNYFAGKMGSEYDEGGKIAASGKFIPELFEHLNTLPFFTQPGAKSLGREWFENDFLRVTENFKLPVNDILHTIVKHSAYQINKVLNKHDLKNVLITGGGAYNTFLIRCIQENYKGEVIIPDDYTINFKEALIFAFLGYLRLNNKNNSLQSVTGAKSDSVGGAVYYMNT